jgi:phosphate-selective porin OprO/OprP
MDAMTLSRAHLLVPALPGFVFLAVLLAPLPAASAADNSPMLPAPMMSPPSEGPDSDLGQESTTQEVPEVEMSLAARVDALEQQLRDLQTAAEKATKKKEAAKAEEAAAACLPKEIPIIDKPTYRIIGRLFFDSVMYADDEETKEFFDEDRQNEFGFRSAWLGVQGYVYENVMYQIELAFQGSEVAFKDTYIEAQSLPAIGRFRAGHFKEPIGLEELTSSNYDTFMEQSYATATFTPARNFGVMTYDSLDACKNLSWYLGTFRSESPEAPLRAAEERDDRNDWCFDARTAWLPYYDEPSGGRYLVHLGGSYSYRHTFDPAEFTTKSWIGNQAPIGVGAAARNNTWNQIGTEFAVMWGSFSVQSEYFQAWVTSGEEYNGAYIQFSYFLTGEHRGYDKVGKVFYRVQPLEPAFLIDALQGWCFGRGAWELTGGYSYTDLKDGVDIETGVDERALVDGFIVGVNWYLNPWSRVMFDYNLESTDFVRAGTPDSTANLFGIRWQVNW